LKTEIQSKDNKLKTIQLFVLAITIVLVCTLNISCESSTKPPEEPQPLGFYDHYPAWSGINNLIAYSHERDYNSSDPDSAGIYVIKPDGTNKAIIYYGNFNTGLSWYPDGKYLIFNANYRLVRVSYPEGIADTITGTGEYWDPVVSPNDTLIAFTRRLGSGAGLYFWQIGEDQPRMVIEDVDGVCWPYVDSLVFLNLDRAYSLYAVMISDTSGSSRREIFQNPGNMIPGSISPKLNATSRRIVFKAQLVGELQSIWALEPGQTAARKLVSYAETPEFSPDGNCIVFERMYPNGKLWIMNWDGTGLRQLTP
jgi:Tol biopolymer transport system component